MADEGQQNQNPTGDTGAGGGNANWYDSLSADLRGNESLKAFDGVESLAKAHLATTEEVASLKQQIEASKPVIPDKPEGYGLPVKVEGYPDELAAEASAQVSRIAHAAGLSKEQAGKALQALVAEESEILKGDIAALEKQAADNKAALQKEFGDQYEATMNNAMLRFSQVAEKAGIKTEDIKALVDGTGIGDNLTFIKFAIGLSKLISPDVFERNQGTDAGKAAAAVIYDHPTSQPK